MFDFVLDIESEVNRYICRNVILIKSPRKHQSSSFNFLTIYNLLTMYKKLLNILNMDSWFICLHFFKQRNTNIKKRLTIIFLSATHFKYLFFQSLDSLLNFSTHLVCKKKILEKFLKC